MMGRKLTYLTLLSLAMCTANRCWAQLPSGWSARDIGNPAAAGSTQYDDATQTWTIQTDGTGITGAADQFHYVYKRLSGNGELIVRVVSLEPPVDEWATAGVMLRVFLDPGSPYAFMGVAPYGPDQDHGLTFWGRSLPGSAADHESSGEISLPYWVKISRVGDTFAGSFSPDGQEWTEQYSVTEALVPQDIYIGLAATSNVAGTLVTAVFDSGPMTAQIHTPEDGAQQVIAPLFRWTPGRGAAFHDVYLGADPDLGPDQFMGRLPVEQTLYYHTPGLAPGTTYYWRVDEVAADEVTIVTGETWHFATAPATAYAPEPWDNLKGVDVETDLRWTPGTEVTAHDVYFGTDRAAVAAGDSSALQGTQIEAVYDPGTLAEDTTYYWRIDEHAAGGVIHAGPLWSFRTIGPGIGVTARYFAGANLSGDPVLTKTEETIDHNWGSGEIVAGISGEIAARWTANLEAPFTETYQLATTTNGGVHLWLDGRLIIDNWTDHAATSDTAVVDLVAGQVYSLSMEWYDGTGGAMAQLSWQSPSIPQQTIPAGPLQLPVRATAPRPIHGAQHAPQTTTLRWIAGEEATHHDVYFGTDADAVRDADATTADIYRGRQGLSDVTYEPGALEWDTTYYWRVDEVGADSSRQGTVWCFTTADFVVIDDFESYTDDEGNWIYETWIDGWTNETGSQIGYSQAPFVEQLISHTDCQSAPLAYDNTAPPYYSEAERTWTTAQDWTVRGVNTLTLHFRGNFGNGPDKLYVALEDNTGKTATVVYPDAYAVLATRWTEWNIPLTDFTGLNPARIRKMYLGLGNRNAPTPGNAGLIYVDDIWVTLSASETTE